MPLPLETNNTWQAVQRDSVTAGFPWVRSSEFVVIESQMGQRVIENTKGKFARRLQGSEEAPPQKS